MVHVYSHTWISSCRQYAVAKTLLENGADVSIQAKDGSTALEIATCSTSGGSHDIVLTVQNFVKAMIKSLYFLELSVTLLNIIWVEQML